MATQDLVGKYAISSDEAQFEGSYDTLQEALDEAAVGYAYTIFWVGVMRSPVQPETYWDAEDWLEHVSVQDEYGSDWAEGWDASTKEQREELEAEICPILAKWLDKYELRPCFFTVTNVVKYEVEDGKVVAVEE